MIIYRKIPQRKGIPMIPYQKKTNFEQCHLVHFPLIRPSRVNLMSVIVCGIRSFSFVSGDLLIPFRPNCPRNCGRAAHQNVEVVLSNHGLLIFLPNCLQKKSALATWMTPKLRNSDTSPVSKKKSISGEHGNIKGWICNHGRKQETDLVQLVPP